MQKAIETNNATKGMDLKNGKRHYDSNGNPLGGIKAKVINSDNQQIEVEMGEVIITRDAVSNPKKYKIEGTTKEILSTLNQEGGGVPINETEAEILAKYKDGGELIKRADGSYSKRGLWDNIRDNVGSGRKPTKKMLEQEAKIKAKYHLGGDMSKHLAPNGKPSNLTHEQWHLVRKPEFKAWFGDWINSPETASKAVDENGEPLVCYHGTKNKNINTFNNVNYNEIYEYDAYGIYSSESIENAKHYSGDTGSIITIFVNIKNPYNLGTREIDKGRPTDKNLRAISKERYEFYIEKGYDGVIFTDLRGIMFEIVAFDPNQIKLADGTNTTFDANNDDIRYAEGGLIAPNGKKSNLTTEQYKLVRTDAFKKWFGDWINSPETASKAVDSNGEPLVVYHGTNEKFNIFDLKSISSNTGNYGHYGYGFYFSDDIEETKTYGDIVLTCFLNFRKPFTHSKKNFILLKENGAYWIDDLEDVAFDKDDLIKKLSKVSFPASELIRLITENGYSEGWGIWAEKYGNINSEIDFNEISDLLDGYSDSNKEYLESIGVENVKTIKDFPQEQTLHWITELGERSKEVTEIMSNIGFDSVIYGSEYVAFNSNQIKLADGTNTTFDANNDDIRYREGGSISRMTPSELKSFYASPEGKKLDAQTYSEWKRLVNMSKSELEKFYNSVEGKKAGLSPEEAKEQGIDSGRESARWVMKMKDIPYKEWSSDMWRWAKKQINFIKRMSGMKGELYDDKGRKTRKHTALLIWGHNPEQKFEGGGVPKDAFTKSENERNEDYEANWNLWIDTLLKNIDLPIEWTTSESRKELYGDSFYITIFNEDWQEFAKLRFSGHSVMNTSRLQNEFHNPNISRFYEIVSRAMNKGQQDKNPEKLVRFKGGGELSKKALAVETNDLTDFVRKYFIKDGRIDVSDAMQELFGNKKGKSIADEYRKRIGLHKKGGLTISQLAHNLWEQHRDEVREGIDDSDFRNAVEEVLISEYGVSSMIKSLMEKSEGNEQDKENEFWMNQFDEGNDEYYEDLSDEEVADYFKDMEGFEKELAKGTEHEMEHLETLKKVAEGKITPEEGVVQTASTHIAENPNYYEDLAKMEAENKEIFTGKMDNGQPFMFFIGKEPKNGYKSENAKELYNENGYWIDNQLGFDNLLTGYFKDYESMLDHTNPKYHSQLGVNIESEESIPDLIEGLKVLAESLEGAEKKEIEDVIEGLEILLESDDKFAKGGEIDNNSMFFEPSRAEEEEEKRIMEDQFGKNI